MGRMMIMIVIIIPGERQGRGGARGLIGRRDRLCEVKLGWRASGFWRESIIVIAVIAAVNNNTSNNTAVTVVVVADGNGGVVRVLEAKGTSENRPDEATYLCRHMLPGVAPLGSKNGAIDHPAASKQQQQQPQAPMANQKHKHQSITK
jgi:hypothetical protein